MNNNCKRIFLKISSWLLLLLSAHALYAGMVIGNPRGHITLVEIYDYQCPYCRAMNSIVAQLIQNNADLRVILRPIPAFGNDSWVEARLALASRYQHRFHLFHQA